MGTIIKLSKRGSVMGTGVRYGYRGPLWVPLLTSRKRGPLWVQGSVMGTLTVHVSRVSRVP